MNSYLGLFQPKICRISICWLSVARDNLNNERICLYVHDKYISFSPSQLCGSQFSLLQHFDSFLFTTRTCSQFNDVPYCWVIDYNSDVVVCKWFVSFPVQSYIFVYMSVTCISAEASVMCALLFHVRLICQFCMSYLFNCWKYVHYLSFLYQPWF